MHKVDKNLVFNITCYMTHEIKKGFYIEFYISEHGDRGTHYRRKLHEYGTKHKFKFMHHTYMYFKNIGDIELIK